MAYALVSLLRAMAVNFLQTKRTKYYLLQSGNSQYIDREIVKGLRKQIQGLVQVNTVEECDVILVSCPIVSRAGTDMEAALKKLNNVSESKPAVFMVIHHTFDPEKIVPGSSSFINRANTITLNMLFNEDDGLLKCDMNEQAVTKITEYIEPLKQYSFSRGRMVLVGIPTVLFCYYFFIHSSK